MNGPRRNLRLALQGLAFGQAGYFTAAQAVNLGYSYQAQRYHVDSGNWLRVDRDLFRLPDWPPAPEDQWCAGPCGAMAAALCPTIRRLLTKDVLDHGAWRVTTPLRTILDLARGDTTQEQVTAAVGAALEQGLTTVQRIRTRSDEAGVRAALRIERALGAAAKP